MSIFETKLALTSNPPTHRLTSRPQGIVSTIDLMEYKEKSTLSSPDDTMLPYTDTVSCIYKVDGKCEGMLTPEPGKYNPSGARKQLTWFCDAP